jgi:hypothetical protein
VRRISSLPASCQDVYGRLMTEQPFQKVWGREGGFLAATRPAVISGLNTVLEKHEENTA